MDYLHFVAVKKKAEFKIKAQIGPFVCNTRTAGKEVDLMLKKLNFNFSFTWSYVPFGLISKMRV